MPIFENLHRESLLLFPGIAWLSLLITQKWKRLLIYPFYLFIVPPLGTLVLTIKFFWKLWKGSIKIFKVAKSTQLAIFLFVLTIIGWVIAIFLANVQIQSIASIIAHTSLFLFFLQSFRWASNPFRPIYKSFDIIWDFIKTLISNNIENWEDLNDFYREATRTWIRWSNNAIDYLIPQNSSLHDGLIGIAKQHIITFAIFSFGVQYFLLALSFAGAISKFEIAWGPVFEGLNTPTSYFDYFYLCISSQATSLPNEVYPINIYGQIWIIWLLLTGILLLTILLAIFTTSVGVQGDRAISDIKKDLEEKRGKIKHWEGLIPLKDGGNEDGTEILVLPDNSENIDD
jgi:hypothetical protein